MHPSAWHDRGPSNEAIDPANTAPRQEDRPPRRLGRAIATRRDRVTGEVGGGQGTSLIFQGYPGGFVMPVDKLSQKQKMLAGELYHAGDPEIQADQAAAKLWMVRYNASLATSATDRRSLLRELLFEVGDGAVIRPPFHCDFGFNITIGPDVFLNFNCVVLDVAPVTIGAGTQIGPAVQIYYADHPRDPEIRKTGAEFGRPVSIGQNVWIGGGAIILPGVTIGDNAVIGAGAVVTRNVGQGVTAVGNPARPVRS